MTAELDMSSRGVPDPQKSSIFSLLPPTEMKAVTRSAPSQLFLPIERRRMKKIKIQYMAFRLIDNTLNNNQQETDGVEAAAKPKCVPMLLVIPCASLVLNGRLLQSAPNLLFSFLFSRPAADGIKTGGGARRKPILFLKFHTAHPPHPTLRVWASFASDTLGDPFLPDDDVKCFLPLTEFFRPRHSPRNVSRW